MDSVDCRRLDGCTLACLNRLGELSKKFFNFPCTCPILDLAHEARLLAFMRDAMFQSSVSAAKYCILTEIYCHHGLGYGQDGRYLLSLTAGQKSFEPSPT